MNDIRTLITKLEQINEAGETKIPNLAPGTFKGNEPRFKKFLWKIVNKDPFLNLERQQVWILPAEARVLAKMHGDGTFAGAISVRTSDKNGIATGDKISLSSLLKTDDLGGQQGDPHKPGVAPTGKESLLVKPKTIGITDQDIPGHRLMSIIVNNPVLNSTDYGKVVIQLARYIEAGDIVAFPEEYIQADMEKVRKAIVDYAGEYLGILAILYGQSDFPKQAAFETWMGGSIADFNLNFPGKSNTNIADSYANITSKDGERKINISSKGTGGGAPPAISGLTIPNDIRKNRKLKTAVQFIELCQKTDTARGPSTISQAFDAMDLIYQYHPESIDKKFASFLPFSSKNPRLVERAVESWKTGVDLPQKYHKMWEGIKPKGKPTDGGLLIYAIKKEVANAMNNKGAIPEFQATILQVLEMNFIQQYALYEGGAIVFRTQWPAKLDGTILVKNKSSVGDPTGGGFSFKLGFPGETDDGDEDTGGTDSTASAEKAAKLDKKAQQAGTAHSIGGLRPIGAATPKSSERKSPDDQRGYRN
jgi:hypothetical protein